MIKLNGLTKSFKKRIIIDNISLEIKNPSLTILNGSSGSGKTTLLNIISGFITPDKGNVELNQQTIFYNLVDDMNINILNVWDNLKLVCSDEMQIENMLKKLDIISLKKKKVAKLSKGEQVRVSIARALLSDANVLIFDEPTGNLDQKNAELVFQIIKEESKHRTIIIATHDQSLANIYADSLYTLEEGKLIEKFDKNTIDKEQTFLNKNKTKTDVYYKYALKKIMSKPILYLLSLVLMILTLTSLFIAMNFSSINEKDTIKVIFDSLEEDYFEISRDNAFTSYSNPKDYIGNREIIQKFKLTSPKMIEDLNAVFYEDFIKIYPLKKDIFEYVLPEEFQEVKNTFYYPVIISDQMRRFFVDNYKKNYQIGDVLDFTFINYSPLQSVQFVIVDIIEVNLDKVGSIYDLFPVIIPKQAYYTMVEEVGIYEAEPFEKVEIDFRQQILEDISIGSLNLVTLSYFPDVVSYETINDEYVGYVYIGDLCQNENEVMLTSISEYEKLTGNYLKPTNKDDEYLNRQKAFLNKYAEGYPISILSLFNNERIPQEKNVKIVGCIAFAYKGELYSEYKLMIMHSSIVNSLLEEIKEKETNIFNYNNEFYISKEELKDLAPRIIDGSIVINNQKVNYAFKQIMDRGALIRLVLFFCLIIFLISLIVLFVYISNGYKEMQKDFMIMMICGKARKDLIRIIILFVSCIIIPSILSLGFLVPITNYIGEVYIHSFGISNARYVFNFGVPFLSIIACIFVYYLITCSLVFLKFRNFQVLDVMKYE